MEKTKIIICGKSGSGKDYLKNLLINSNKGYLYAISHTTRPKRENEIDGKDYHFVSEETFLNMINKGLFVEHTKFNNWYYGLTKISFEMGNVFILTPSGIKQLPEYFKKQSLIIYLDIDEITRANRLYNRKDNQDSVYRRMKADNEDFANFTEWNIRITDSKQLNF